MGMSRRAILSASFRTLSRPAELSVGRACAVKPCTFGAPLRLWGLTARHGQTRGIRALMEISMPIADLAGECATGRPSQRSLMPT